MFPKRAISNCGIPLLVSILIVLWQVHLFRTGDLIPRWESIRGVVGGGAHHLEAYRRFFVFEYFTREFPVASLVPKPPEETAAFGDWLSKNGSSLTMEVHEAYRMGDVGKIYLFWADAWLRGNVGDATYRSANFLYFTLALLVFFWGLWGQGQRGLAALVVLFVGSSKFQTYEAYGHANIFSWPISTLLLTAGLNAGFLFGPRDRARRWGWILAAIATGVWLATVRQIRSEPVILVVSFALIYLLGAGAWKWRLALPLVLLLSYFGTARVWRGHFARRFESARNFVRERGGHVYAGPVSPHHFFWHPFFCGLGDFGERKGYKWSDFAAYAYALPKLRELHGDPNLWKNFQPDLSLSQHFMEESYDAAGVYRKKLEDVPGYDGILREKILRDLREDPLWGVNVFLKRLDRLFSRTSGLQIWTPWHTFDFRFPIVGWLPLLLLWPLIRWRQWGVLGLMGAAFSLAAPALLINSGLNLQFFSIAYLVAVAWLLLQLPRLSQVVSSSVAWTRRRIPSKTP